jgi:hypothetical protein
MHDLPEFLRNAVPLKSSKVVKIEKNFVLVLSETTQKVFNRTRKSYVCKEYAGSICTRIQRIRRQHLRVLKVSN